MDKENIIEQEEKDEDFSDDEEENEQISLEEKEKDNKKTRIGNKIYDLDTLNRITIVRLTHAGFKPMEKQFLIYQNL